MKLVTSVTNWHAIRSRRVPNFTRWKIFGITCAFMVANLEFHDPAMTIHYKFSSFIDTLRTEVLNNYQLNTVSSSYSTWFNPELKAFHSRYKNTLECESYQLFSTVRAHCKALFTTCFTIIPWGVFLLGLGTVQMQMLHLQWYYLYITTVLSMLQVFVLMQFDPGLEYRPASSRGKEENSWLLLCSALTDGPYSYI